MPNRKPGAVLVLLAASGVLAFATPAWAGTAANTQATLQMTAGWTGVDRTTGSAVRSRVAQVAPGDTAQQLAQRMSAPVLPLSAALAEQGRENNVHVVPGARRGNASPAAYPGEDWITRDDCRNKWASPGFRGPWHYRNHYSACQVWTVTITFQQCQRNGAPPCEDIGQTRVRATIIGRGHHNTRAIDWDVWLDEWQLVWGVELPDTPLTVNIPCQAYTTNATCKVTPADGITRKIVEWRLDVSGPNTWFGYAACEYSLMRPPRIGRRRTRADVASTTSTGRFGGR